MKKPDMILALILLLTMIFAPLLAIRKDKNAVKASLTVESASEKSEKETGDTVKIYLTKSKKIKKITLTEYLIGVAAKEMDAQNEAEALKAQVVAAHSVFLFRKAENTDKKYDITDDCSIDQSYITNDERKKLWGKNYKEYESKIKQAVSLTENEYLTYKGKVAFAAYHAISGGKTESAENVWGGDYPYLQAVESVSDMLASDYISTVTYTEGEFKSLLSALDVDIENDIKIKEPECTKSGTVKTIIINETALSGADVRKAFNLRSANFDLSKENGKFIFTVRGWGHGVGMSQYGANYMAKMGSNYKEILNWYYTDCLISKA